MPCQGKAFQLALAAAPTLPSRLFLRSLMAASRFVLVRHLSTFSSIIFRSSGGHWSVPAVATVLLAAARTGAGAARAVRTEGAVRAEGRERGLRVELERERSLPLRKALGTPPRGLRVSARANAVAASMLALWLPLYLGAVKGTE